MQRYGAGATGPEFMDAVRAQAAKRVALQFVPRRVASWDHRKLGGRTGGVPCGPCNRSRA